MKSPSKDQLRLELDAPDFVDLDMYKPFKQLARGILKLSQSVMSIFL